MSALTWKNIDCIPSIHGAIPYAVAVQTALEARPYDCIAVELSPEWALATGEAVRRLPRVTAVARRTTAVVVMPGDSLVEGIRQGLQRGIPVEFVDLDVPCAYEKGSAPPLPDPYCIQVNGLARYFELAGPLFRLARPPRNHNLRNRHMAWRIAALARKHRRVLFICGAAHWEEIARLLDTGDDRDCSARASRTPPRVVHLDDNRILNVPPWNGEIPFYRWLFFTGARTAEVMMARLLDGAVRNYRYEPGVRDIKKVQQYAARLARTRCALTPDLCDLLAAARDIVGAAFAGEVLKVAYSYPSQRDPSRLETCLEKALLVRLEARGWQGGSDGTDIEVVLAEFGEKERRNPKTGDRQGVRFSGSDWGRYGDEMEREEAFLQAIVRNYVESVRPEPAGAVEFDGDLRGGLDARETIRARIAAPANRRVFVRDEERAARDDVGAVVLLFDPDEGRYPCDCFTYGRHLGFGFVTEPERGRPTAKVRWGLLASFLRTYDGAGKKRVVDQLYAGQIRYSSYDRCLRETLRLARRPRVLYVAASPPPAWVAREAAQGGKVVSYVPVSSLPEALLEDIRTYNVYFYPEDRTRSQAR